MYYQKPSRGSGLAQMLGGLAMGFAQRHQNRLQERDEEARQAGRELRTQLEIDADSGDPEAKRRLEYAERYRRNGGDERRLGQWLNRRITAEKQQGLATPITPEMFTEQLPKLGEPVWKPGPQGDGEFGLSGTVGRSGQGEGRLRLAQYLALNPAGGGNSAAGSAGSPAVRASGSAVAPETGLAAGPGKGVRASSGARSRGPSMRLQNLVADWEELYGRPAPDLIRSRITDYLRQGQV